MRPSFPAQSLLDGTRRCADVTRDRRHRGACRAKPKGLDNRSFGEPRVPRSGSPRLPALAHLVGHIIRASAEKVMAGVTARRIVALVKHAESLRNRAVDEFPRNAMRRLHTPRSRASDLTIAHMVRVPSPDPAGPEFDVDNWTVLVDARPQTLRRGVAPLARTRRASPLFAEGFSLCPASAHAGRTLRLELWRASPSSIEILGVRGLLLPTLATPLRDLYRRIVHWVISSGPVPGCFNTPGTFVWSLSHSGGVGS